MDFISLSDTNHTGFLISLNCSTTMSGKLYWDTQINEWIDDRNYVTLIPTKKEAQKLLPIAAKEYVDLQIRLNG